MIRRFFKRHRKKLITLGTALGTASVMYTIWGGSAFVLIALFVVVVHEIGHITAAHLSGADVGFTFFIPLIVGIVGATQIINIPPDKAGQIAIAGPLFGLAASVIVGSGVVLMELTALYVPVMILISFEAFNLLVGSDSKKYRRAKRAMRR